MKGKEVSGSTVLVGTLKKNNEMKVKSGDEKNRGHQQIGGGGN